MDIETTQETSTISPEAAAVQELNSLFEGDGADQMLDSSAEEPALSEPTPAEEPAPAPAPAAAATTAEPTSPAATPPAASPAATPSTEAAAAPTPAPAPEPAPSDPPILEEDVAKQLEAWAQLYGVTEEEALLFQTEPEKALPKMAARLHANVLMNLGQILPAVIPQVLAAQQMASSRETEAKDMFFKAWPDLKDHSDAVVRVGKAYRAANPDAPADVAIKEIGEIVAKSLNLTPSAPAGTPPAAAAAPVAPAQQVQFRPAGAGGARGATPAKSEWETMLEDAD